MSVTQDYKSLTLADRSVIRIALLRRQAELDKLIADAVDMAKRDQAYDRLLTQLRGELDQTKTALRKVRP